jgi:hypothetical protein
MVAPEYAGGLDDALIAYAARRFGARSPLTIEHPADDEVATSVFQRHHFYRQWTRVHMRWDAHTS